ncbi:MAG: hypothetical protein ACYS9X_29405 [Planctomycetota bacterium]|jgi:hypothetical protein
MPDGEAGPPRVRWGEREISRLVIGHNPMKGCSHLSKALDAEMRDWYDPSRGRDLEVLRRAEECGINTAQFGAPVMHSLLSRHKAEGGGLQWIATFYEGDDPEAELEAILGVDPAPIGIQYFGERVDRNFIEGRVGRTRDMTKRLRDTGLLVGVCSHLPQTIEQVESEGWDVDFYQTCFYTVYAKVSEGRIDRGEERYDNEDRERMAALVGRVSKPCIAFKVLGASRNCATPADVEAALSFAYDRIKPTDVVAVGMWQKHADQVGENTALVRKILAEK